MRQQSFTGRIQRVATATWFPSPRRASAAYLIAASFIIFAIWIPNDYFTIGTFQLIGEGQAVAGIVALAILVPFTAGAFDLSAGSMVTFSLAIVSSMELHMHTNVIVACLVAVGACAVVGLISGIVVTRYRVNSFIATLAMGQIIAAGALLLSNDQQISDVFGKRFLQAGQGVWFGVPKVLCYLVVLALVLWYVLEWTPVGRRLFATGANVEAARLGGIATDRLTVGSLMASAVIAGLGGIVFGAQVGSFSNSFGEPLLFPAFAAIFFGATQFKNRPNVWGTIVAMFTLAFGVQGLNLGFQGQAFWITTLFDGVALILAVAVASRTSTDPRLRAVGRALRGRRGGSPDGRRSELGVGGERGGGEPAGTAPVEVKELL